MTANNSSQKGNTEYNNDSCPVIHAPYGSEVWGPDGKGNIYYHESSSAPMKSRVLRVSEDGTCTEYINLTRETKAGDQLKDAKNDVCILLDATKGKIIIYAEKGSVDIRARENINLHAEKGNINLHAPNGDIVLSSKELKTGDMVVDPITRSRGKKPKIMMNSKSGGNFCGVMLPHKFCWDYVGQISVPLGDNLSTLTSKVNEAIRKKGGGLGGEASEAADAAIGAKIPGISEAQSAIKVISSVANGLPTNPEDLVKALTPVVIDPIIKAVENKSVIDTLAKLFPRIRILGVDVPRYNLPNLPTLHLPKGGINVTLKNIGNINVIGFKLPSKDLIEELFGEDGSSTWKSLILS
jgi:hypothetical protein